MQPMTLKHQILTAAVCLLAASAQVQAGPDRQKGGWEPPSAEERVERLSEELGLDESQEISLLEILTAADVEREALRERHEAQVRADVCTLQSSTDAEIKAVLTSEQAAEFDALMEKMSARRDKRAERHGRDHRSLRDCKDTGA